MQDIGLLSQLMSSVIDYVVAWESDLNGRVGCSNYILNPAFALESTAKNTTHQMNYKIFLVLTLLVLVGQFCSSEGGYGNLKLQLIMYAGINWLIYHVCSSNKGSGQLPVSWWRVWTCWEVWKWTSSLQRS